MVKFLAMSERSQAEAGQTPLRIPDKFQPFLQGLIEDGLEYEIIARKLTKAGMEVEGTDVQGGLDTLKYTYGDHNTGLVFAVRAGYFHKQLVISRASKLKGKDLLDKIKRVLADEQTFAIWMGTVEGLTGPQIGKRVGLSGGQVRDMHEIRFFGPLKTNRYGLVALGLEVKELVDAGKLKVGEIDGGEGVKSPHD